MKSVKLSQDLWIGSNHFLSGDVVMVPDLRAVDLVNQGCAEDHDGGGEIANPDYNKFEDVITPMPPGGLVVNPVDALSPDVQDNPGLKKLAELAGAKSKSAKVRPEDVAPTGEKTASIEPGTTANEIVPATK